MHRLNFIFVFSCLLFLWSCSKTSQKPSENIENIKQKVIEAKKAILTHETSPVVYIYKTRKDYSHLVPVIMNADRTRILSYPAPSDLIRNGQLTLPTALDKGYWLDNRGITPNVVFLSYTYEEYSKMPTAPSKEEMLKHIEDKYPLVNIINCGKRADYKDLVTELNQYIHDQNLK